jgi:hypothetical protein
MRLRRVIPAFIFGVSIGLIIGVGFFVFKFNDLFLKLKDSAKDHITVIEQPIKNVTTTINSKKKNNEQFKINIQKGSNVNYNEVDSLLKEDSNINIATDVLLTVKTVKLIKINDRNSDRDSVAARLANVEQNTSSLYFIEFWKTPLNSKGYRFTKNKILLYGFADFNNVLIYEVDNSYYLKSADQVFKLFYGGDFRKLEKVSDMDLLAKLN